VGFDSSETIEGEFITTFGGRTRFSLRETTGSVRLLYEVSNIFRPMSFDFAVNDSSTETVNNDSDDVSEEISTEFENNEVADLYLSIGDWKGTVGKILKALEMEQLKIYSDDTLEDVGRLLGEYTEAHPMQKLHMVASLAKATAGKMQRENDHGIGLQKGKAPEEHFEESVSYALFFSDLPAIEWESLDGGERENLEEMGIDPSSLGFDTTFGGPKLLVVGGERLPIVVEEGNEVMEAVNILQGLPGEPSAYTEDGFRESSDGSVFGESEDSTETESTENGGEVNLAANPERVKEVNVGDIKAEVTGIDSLRTIQTMLRVESDSESPRSSAIKRLKERRNALQNGSQNEGSDAEGDEEADDDKVAEAVDSVEEDTEEQERELDEGDKALMAAMLNNGDVESREEAKEEVLKL